jgi:hypothetical protein
MTRNRMTDFGSLEPAILHDRLDDTIEPWTGEDADDYRQSSIAHPRRHHRMARADI